jgi:hypothetical protein
MEITNHLISGGFLQSNTVGANSVRHNKLKHNLSLLESEVVILNVVKDLNVHLGERFFTAFRMTQQRAKHFIAMTEKRI